MPYERVLPPLLLLSNIFHDLRLVRAPEVQGGRAVEGGAGQLGIAFFEYLLMIPANRIGSALYSAPQLKGMQEVITLLVLAGFSIWYLGQPLSGTTGRASP